MFGLMVDEMECPVDLLKLTQSINQHEGLRLFPYTDTTGNITVGYGTNISAGITNDEAAYLRDNRIQLAIREAEAAEWWPHVKDNDARARSTIECIFNLGITGFNNFTKTISALCAGDFDTASVELLNSLWAKQVGKRAEVLASMMKTGQDRNSTH